jgi:GNAT superfamily N-acetyltransferase
MNQNAEQFTYSLQSHALSAEQQQTVNEGFSQHSQSRRAPAYKSDSLSWVVTDESSTLVGVLTANALWDWIYIDELWVAEQLRGQGVGLRLMDIAEEYGREHTFTGLWLWTQSWQAADFYMQCGYEEFTRFPDFPKGHFRIGFRKQL